MCIDNPREEFANIFDTHPSVDDRVAALIKFAGGHDPGPLAIEPPREETPADAAPPEGGPWGDPAPATRRAAGPVGTRTCAQSDR